MVGNAKGNEGNDGKKTTSAVVVPVDDAATPRPPPPAGSASVATMVMGATTHGPGVVFFYQILIDVFGDNRLPNMCSWISPIGSKPAPNRPYPSARRPPA